MENKEISPDSLQNPSEPDATFRMKANKVHTGYVLNVVEARDNEKEMSMIIYQEEQQNETSDVELDQNTLDAELKGVEDIVNDGAYYSLDTVKKAEERKIEMIFSALNGRKVEDGCFGVNEFVIDPSTHAGSLCQAAKQPVFSAYDAEKEVYTAKFAKEACFLS